MKLHLPKALFTAVLAAFAVSQTTWAATTHEVWTNFGCTGDTVNSANTALNMPAGDAWNNIVKPKNNGHATGIYTLTDTTDAEVASLNLQINANCWGPDPSHSANVLEQMQSSYLDVNGAGQRWSMELVIDDISARDVNLTLYFSGDNDVQYAPVIVNGTSYIGGTNTEGSDKWGVRQYSTTMDANNTIILTDVGSAISMSSTHVDGGRATISGMSFSYTSDLYTATLGSGDNAAAGLSYTYEGNTVAWADINTADAYISVAGAEDGTSVYTLAAGADLKGLQVSSQTVTLDSAGAITVDKLWVSRDATLKLNAQLTAGSSVTNFGTININADQSLAQLVSTTGNLTIAEGATVTLTGKGSSTVNLSVNGQLVVAEDAELSIVAQPVANNNADSNFKNILTHTTGEGVINVSGGGEAYIQGGKNGSTWKTDFAGKLSMAADTKLVLGFAATGGYDWYKWSVNLSNTLIELNGGDMRFNGEKSSVKGIVVQGENTLHIQDSRSYEDAKALSIGTLDLQDQLTITNEWAAGVGVGVLTGSGDLIINAKGNAGDNRRFNLTISDFDDYEGAIHFNAGSNTGCLSIGTANDAIDLAATISSTGAIQFAEGLTINISSVEKFKMVYSEEASLWDVAAEAASQTGNGFLSKAGTLYVVDGGTNNLADTTVTYKGTELTRNDDGTYNVVTDEFGGDYQLGGTGDHAGANLSDIADLAAAAGKELTGVVLKNGNTLTVDKATTAMLTINAGETGAASLHITEGITLSSANVTVQSGAMTFSGDGTYTMLGGLKGTAASDWTGHVYLEAKENGTPGNKGEELQDIQDLDLTKYGNANSKITIRGLNGSLAQNMGTVESDLELLNSDGSNWAALCLVEGYASTYTFSGDITGNGNFRIDVAQPTAVGENQGMTFHFQGDISGFTGQLFNVHGSHHYVFSDKATNIKADVKIGDSGTMNIKADNTADTTIQRIDVQNGGSLVLENANTGTLKVSALKDNASTAISAKATSGNIEITVQDGAATMTDIAVGSSHTVTVTANLTVSGKLTVAAETALVVNGDLTFADTATIDASQFTLGTTLTGQEYSFTLGTATGAITGWDAATLVLPTIEGYSVELGVQQLTNPAMVADGESTPTTYNALVLKLTANQPAEQPLDKLTITGGSYDEDTKVLTFTTLENATGAVFGTTLNATMTDAKWDEILADISTTLDDEVKVSFMGADDKLFDFNGDGTAQVPTITINGEGAKDGNQVLSGEGDLDGTIVGNYVTAYIPEPTTTTLSLLALAGLAVRRRRASR